MASCTVDVAKMIGLEAWDFSEQSSIASSVVDVSKIAEQEDDVHFDNLSAVSSWFDVGSPKTWIGLLRKSIVDASSLAS